jgi:hypothetical protein
MKTNNSFCVVNFLPLSIMLESLPFYVDIKEVEDSAWTCVFKSLPIQLYGSDR